MHLKNIMAAVFSAVIISGAGIAVSIAASESAYTIGDHVSAATEAATSAASSVSSTTAAASSTNSALTSVDSTSTTTETTTEPTTVKTYAITFLDFEGKVLTSIDVPEGENIDYASIDTSPLHEYLDVNTEKDFSSWDITPSKADKDYTIHALSKVATIYYKKKPDKYRYFSTKGKVNLDGLQAFIDISVQTPQKNKDGTYVTENQTLDISSSCVAKPATLAAAFALSDKATISVYPIGAKKALCSFDIICYRNLGDINEDGNIDSVDASMVLTIYANLAASRTYKATDQMKKLSDVNMDDKIDALDASYILKYYAIASTAKDVMDWENILDYDKILKK